MPSGFVGAVTCTGEFWWLYVIHHYLLLHLFGALPGTGFLIVRFHQICFSLTRKFGNYGNFASDGIHHSHHWWASLSDFCVYYLYKPVLVWFPSLLCLLSFYRWISVHLTVSHWVIGYPLLCLGLYLSVGRHLHTWGLTFCRILLGRPIPFIDWFRVVHSSFWSHLWGMWWPIPHRFVRRTLSLYSGSFSCRSSFCRSCAKINISVCFCRGLRTVERNF